MRERLDAVLVGLDPFFNSRRIQLVQLATRYAIPTSYPARDFAEAGGLISYGANIADAWCQVGVYAGRILKGVRSEIGIVSGHDVERVSRACHRATSTTRRRSDARALVSAQRAPGLQAGRSEADVQRRGDVLMPEPIYRPRPS